MCKGTLKLKFVSLLLLERHMSSKHYLMFDIKIANASLNFGVAFFMLS